MSVARYRFQLKAGNSWELREYKGRLRVVMNRDFGQIKQPIRGYDVLPVGRARDLAAWLNRYLGMVQPTEASIAATQARAHARGIDRAITTLETKL
jgi:hypothetical protein